MKTAWLILFFAGVTEVTWAIAMKYSEGFTRLVPSVVTAVFYIASVVLLALALHKLHSVRRMRCGRAWASSARPCSASCCSMRP